MLARRYPRGFAFYLADPISSVHEFTPIAGVVAASSLKVRGNSCPADRTTKEVCYLSGSLLKRRRTNERSLSSSDHLLGVLAGALRQCVCSCPRLHWLKPQHLHPLVLLKWNVSSSLARTFRPPKRRDQIQWIRIVQATSKSSA